MWWEYKLGIIRNDDCIFTGHRLNNHSRIVIDQNILSTGLIPFPWQTSKFQQFYTMLREEMLKIKIPKLNIIPNPNTRRSRAHAWWASIIIYLRIKWLSEYVMNEQVSIFKNIKNEDAKLKIRELKLVSVSSLGSQIR